MNECASSPCRPDQVCVELVGHHACRCPPGQFEKESSNVCVGKCLKLLLERLFYRSPSYRGKLEYCFIAVIEEFDWTINVSMLIHM